MPSIPIPQGYDTQLFSLGSNILGEVPEIVSKLWPGKQPVVIADENTWRVAGSKVNQLLIDAGLNPDEPLIFPAFPVMHADYKYIPGIVQKIQGKVPVAVGSGTINDLTKRSTFEAKLPGYFCVATACSVDGYTSFGAAITVNNFKQTLACPAPLAILADSDVLASAPMDMTASGYADLCAKVVGGADWYIADALGETPLDAKAWGMVQTHLMEWIASPEKIAAGDRDALMGLFNGLASSGFSMQYYHDSRPASGAEHLYSHTWEMDNLMVNGVNPSHGFKVGVGTLISTLLMEKTFALSKEEVAKICAEKPEISLAEREAQIDARLKGAVIYDAVKKVCLGKLLTGDALKARRQQIIDNWDSMKEKVLGQILPYKEMKRRFELMGCPVKPEQIGLDRDEFLRGINVAAMIRKRYTILDLLFEMGVLEEFAEQLVLY